MFKVTEYAALSTYKLGLCLRTDISLACFYGTFANSADQDQTPHNAVSDHDLHCLLTKCYIKI